MADAPEEPVAYSTEIIQPFPSAGRAWGKVYAPRDPASIPPRARLYGAFLQRQTVSLTVAPGGFGKSSLAIVEALALATGKPLLHEQPIRPCRVALWNGEDAEDELFRRVEAARLAHAVSGDALGDRLILGNAEFQPMQLARQSSKGVEIDEAAKADMVRWLRAAAIDAWIIDPFVCAHSVSENDNGAVQLVLRALASIAIQADCAIHLVHHARKTAGPVEIDDARGASSLIAAVRAARVLNVMSAEDHERWSPDASRFAYVSIADGKANFAPRSDTLRWFELREQRLGNVTALYPAGDFIGVPVIWEPPGLFDDITAHDLLSAQRAIAADGPWLLANQGARTARRRIAEALGWDTEQKESMRKLSVIIKYWISNRAFKVSIITDEKRRQREALEVDQWADA